MGRRCQVSGKREWTLLLVESGSNMGPWAWIRASPTIELTIIPVHPHAQRPPHWDGQEVVL